MDRSGPVLIPEWLKSNGSVSGGSNSNQQSSSLSSAHSDDKANVLPARSKYSFNNGGYDSPRSVFSGSSYFENRKPARNGSVRREKNSLQTHSSFGRSRYDRDWDEDLFDFCNKERWFLGDRRDRHSNPFGVPANSFKTNGRIENNKLRRSQSMISGKQGELCPRQIAVDSRVDNNKGCNNGWGVKDGSIQKVAFKSDFPSLGAGERPESPEIARASSPRLSSFIQSLPLGSSAVIGQNGCVTEVPIVAGSNSMEHSSVQQHAPGRLPTAASSTTSGLNMAKALVRAPSRAYSAPQVSVEAQRLEELAIKQSRQLIPMTSLVPKTSVLNSEKPKLKLAGRSEMNLNIKSGHQQLPVASPLSAIAPHRSSNNLIRTAADQKASNHPAIYAPTLEKRSTASQAQSRNDFFKLVRKKSSMNLSSAPTDLDHHVLSTLSESSVNPILEISTTVSQANDPPSLDSSCHDWLSGNGATIASNGEAFEESQQTHLINREKCSIPFEVVCCPDEEERAFLYSLGWEENGEDEGLTEEEINAFYKNMQVKPSLKINCRIWQPKRPAPLISHLGSFDSAELSSSDSDSDSDA